jgi:hypothetical protein
MIKRSIPVTFSAFCESSDYAQGMKDGISHALECLLHECDVIMRVSPYVIQLTTEEPDNDKTQKYQVRARFTAREKRPGKERGEWIKTDHAYYEEEFDNRFDTDRDWKSLTDEEIMGITGITSLNSDWNVKIVHQWIHDIEQALKEKNT